MMEDKNYYSVSGLYRNDGKQMEATIYGLGFKVWGLGFRVGGWVAAMAGAAIIPRR